MPFFKGLWKVLFQFQRYLYGNIAIAFKYSLKLGCVQFVSLDIFAKRCSGVSFKTTKSCRLALPKSRIRAYERNSLIICFLVSPSFVQNLHIPSLPGPIFQGWYPLLKRCHWELARRSQNTSDPKNSIFAPFFDRWCAHLLLGIPE